MEDELAASVKTQSITTADCLLDNLFPDRHIFAGFLHHDTRDLSVTGFMRFLTNTHATPDSPIHALSNSSQQTQDGENISVTEETPEVLDLSAAKQEEPIATYVNGLVLQAYDYAGIRRAGAPPKRTWTAGGRNNPLPGLDAHRKPDIVCNDADCPNPDWRAVHSVVEIKNSAQSASTIQSGCRERASCIFRSQDCRRYTITAMLVRDELTVGRYDRGGSEIIGSFNIDANMALFLRFILGISLAPRDRLGYDQTVLIYQPRRYIISAHLGLIDLHLTGFITRSTEGRGTVVWLASVGHHTLLEALPGHLGLHIGSPVVVKSEWHDDTNSITEGMILALLEMKGVQGVPHLICEERVPAPIPGYVGDTGTASSSNLPDSTTFIRADLGLAYGHMTLIHAALRDARANSEKSMTGYQPRAHVRRFSTPWGQSILHFRCGMELLSVFVDLLVIYEQGTRTTHINNGQPFPFRILHRDPSPNNFGMVPQSLSTLPEDPKRKGYYRALLFDWGLAAITSVPEFNQELANDSNEETTPTSRTPPSACFLDNAPSTTEPSVSAGTDSATTTYADTDTHAVSYSTPSSASPCVASPEVPAAPMAPTATSESETPGDQYIVIPTNPLECDSGLLVADPDLLADREVFIDLVKRFITDSEDKCHQDVTGTRPYMSIEMLLLGLQSQVLTEVAEGHAWKISHEIFHDLEAFYFILLYMCIRFRAPHQSKIDERPTHIPPQDKDKYTPEWMDAWMLEEHKTQDGIKNRWVRFCTVTGFYSHVAPAISPYFVPMIPYLNELRALLYGNPPFWQDVYPTPTMNATYDDFLKILRRAMEEIPQVSDTFGMIVEPAKKFYAPINPEGRWHGEDAYDPYQPPLQLNTTYVPGVKERRGAKQAGMFNVSTKGSTLVSSANNNLPGSAGSSSANSAASSSPVSSIQRHMYPAMQVMKRSSKYTPKSSGMESSFVKWLELNKNHLYGPYKPNNLALHRREILEEARRSRS